MTLWLRWHRLKHPFTLKQRLAISGKIPMTKELFWDCMAKCHERYDSETRRKIWKEHHQYIEEFNAEFEREMADPNSELRKEHDAWWADLRSRLVEDFGEDWVRENCRE